MTRRGALPPAVSTQGLGWGRHFAFSWLHLPHLLGRRAGAQALLHPAQAMDELGRSPGCSLCPSASLGGGAGNTSLTGLGEWQSQLRAVNGSGLGRGTEEECRKWLCPCCLGRQELTQA